MSAPKEWCQMCREYHVGGSAHFLQGESSFAATTGSGAADTENRDWPICPHCGEDDDDAALDAVEGGCLLQCPHCGKMYHAEKNTTVTFTTKKPPNTKVCGPSDGSASAIG